jgi:hypothetical protein
LTIARIKQFFANLKEISEILIKLPVGSNNADTLPEDLPPAGYIAIGIEANELQWLNTNGEKGLVIGGGGEPGIPLVSWMGGWL